MRSRQRRRPHAVKIQTFNEAPQPGGGRAGPWVDGPVVPCEIERLQSFRFDVERQIGGAQTSAPLVRIHVDAFTETLALKNGDRLEDTRTGKIFNINAIQDLAGDDRALVISASENAPS